MSRPYQICTRCVMDTTDVDITFDAHGMCNHCRAYDADLSARVPRGESARVLLQQLIENVKAAGRGKEYDCVIGVSGGVDSTYVAYMVKQLGLRPLAVHLDNGWNSELAVDNIAKILDRL